MPELTLTPIAARVQWRVNKEAGATDWPKIIRRFVEEVAWRVVGSPPDPDAQHAALGTAVDGKARNVIGHIKGLVRCDGYQLRVNCVSASLPVDVEGKIPESVSELTLELVLLVYGLRPEQAREAMKAAFGVMQDASATLQLDVPMHQHHSVPVTP
jgi:hypothetical protein